MDGCGSVLWPDVTWSQGKIWLAACNFYKSIKHICGGTWIQEIPVVRVRKRAPPISDDTFRMKEFESRIFTGCTKGFFFCKFINQDHVESWFCSLKCLKWGFYQCHDFRKLTPSVQQLKCHDFQIDSTLQGLIHQRIFVVGGYFSEAVVDRI